MKNPSNVSVSLQLTKTDFELLTIEISSKKVRANKLDFSTIEITSNKVSGSKVDFSFTDFSIGETTSK